MVETSLSESISDFIQGRSLARMEKVDKEAEKQRKELAGDLVKLAEWEADFVLRRAEQEASYKPAAWLADAATRAKQISMVTHALKYTHSDAKGTSIYSQDASNSKEQLQYLSTAALRAPRIDVVGNAAALDVASLLQLEAEGESLSQQIALGNSSALAPFAESPEQLNEWMLGFQQALADKSLSSHKLAKQLYFPVGNGYHLIGPLYASSLAQALYERIAASRFSEEAKASRKARKEERYSSHTTVDFPGTAVQSFGGTKPQNISQLNSSRGGKSFLLSCQPPVWEARITPPNQSKNAFWRAYERRAWPTAKALQKYLLKHLERDSTLAIRERREAYLDELIGVLLQTAAEVQSLTEYAGWSRKSPLSIAEQLWLDPMRDDEAFQLQREKKDWQQEVANQFASWLNYKLKHEKLVLKDVEYREWSSLVERKLALLKEDLEVLES